MEFQGIYFSKSIPNGKEVSAISIGAQQVLLKGVNHEGGFTTFELEIEIGGANNHLIFFHHPDSPEESFYIEKNKESLLHLEALEIRKWQDVLASNRKKQFNTNTIWIVLILIVLGFFYSIFASRGYLAGKVVESIPYSLEQKIGDALIGNVLSPNQVYADEKLKEALVELLQPLFAQVPAEYQNFKVHISKAKELNAFALPGGQIVFNYKVLEEATTAEEILGVAAHEMAHVTQRHVLRNMIQAMGVFTLFQLVLGDITGIIAVLSDQGTFLLMKGFSRSIEEDADEKGMQYLINANIDPRGMANFFRLIKKSYQKMGTMGEVNKSMDGHLNFLSTHPSTDSRIEKIEATYQNLNSKIKDQFKSKFPAFEKIKAMIKEK